MAVDFLETLQWNVLDKGFVRIVDTMGDDSSIVQAARVSYGAGTKTLREDRRLIEYLMAHEHMTPFEMAVVKFHVKAPIFVARQWRTHRTLSWNEQSARYSEMQPEFYIPEPEHVSGQSHANRQGRGVELPEQTRLDFAEAVRMNSLDGYVRYQAALQAGVSRELARLLLPVNLYTEFYITQNLRNFFHFLGLRADEHAQWEIRQYAHALEGFAAHWVPVAYGAWVENGRR